MANASLNLVRSSNTQISANRANPSAKLNWQHEQERGRLNVTASYSQASTFLTEPSVIGLIPVNSTQTTRSLSANLDRQVTERFSLSVNGNYANHTYNRANGYSLNNYAMKTAGLRLNYDFSQYAKPYASATVTDSRPQGRSGNKQYNAMLGLHWINSERMDWDLRAGESRVDGSNNGVLTNSAGTTHSSWQGEVTMNYRGQRKNLSINAGRQTKASGVGAFNLVDTASAQLNYELTERTSAELRLAWSKSNYLTGNLRRTSEILLHHGLGATWSVETYCRYASNARGGYNPATSSAIGFSLTYSSL